MITVIDRTNRHMYSGVIEAAYRLRYDVFITEMGWKQVKIMDGLEVDQFDTSEVVEMVYQDRGTVVGYQRLLPTTSPYLLSDVYPHLCDGEIPRDRRLYEWTRFAVAKGYRGDGRSLGPVALDLVTSFVEWGLANDVSAMIVEMTPAQLLRFALCHFRPFPLGVTALIGNEEILAVKAEFDGRTLKRLRDLRGSETSILPRASH